MARTTEAKGFSWSFNQCFFSNALCGNHGGGGVHPNHTSSWLFLIISCCEFIWTFGFYIGTASCSSASNLVSVFSAGIFVSGALLNCSMVKFPLLMIYVFFFILLVLQWLRFGSFLLTQLLLLNNCSVLYCFHTFPVWQEMMVFFHQNAVFLVLLLLLLLLLFLNSMLYDYFSLQIIFIWQFFPTLLVLFVFQFWRMTSIFLAFFFLFYYLVFLICTLTPDPNVLIQLFFRLRRRLLDSLIFKRFPFLTSSVACHIFDLVFTCHLKWLTCSFQIPVFSPAKV